jgi:hypothetical protein
VNVDETTYMFSPKVLDRANVIEFNEVDPEGYMSKNRKDEHFFLENPDILDDLIDREIEPYCSIQDYEKFKHIIENEDKDNPIVDLINRLKFYNLHFGYRVINEISRFIWLSENYIKEGFETNMAFDIQILQKILPKLHGTRGKLESPLKDLLSFCYGNSNWEESVSDETIEKALNFDENAIYPRSAKKIGRMLMNLNNQGYVSFIE